MQAEAIRRHRMELPRILAKGQAKVLPLAQVEVDFTADYFGYYAGWRKSGIDGADAKHGFMEYLQSHAACTQY